MRRCIAPVIAVGLCFAMSGHAWGQVAEQAPKEPRKPGDPQIGPQLRTEWTDAIAQALTQPGLTMAVAPLRRLAEPGGVLDALEAQGFEVDGPQWKAAPSGG